MDNKSYLNISNLRKVWKDEFLPSVKQEIKNELESLRTNIKTLTARVDSIENSQAFIWAKYDSVLESLQTVNKTTDMLGKKRVEMATTTDSLVDKTDSMEQSMYRVDCTLDEMQQYSRRDCLEITGIPVLSDDNPKQLVKEIGSLIDVDINDSHNSSSPATGHQESITSNDFFYYYFVLFFIFYLFIFLNNLY